LYGFFPAGDSGDFWFEVLLLFNDPSQDSVAGRPHSQMPPGRSSAVSSHQFPT
jgi:hypothetical protein